VLALAAFLTVGIAGPAGADERLELTLEQAIELALAQSDALAASRAGADAALARAKQVRSGFFPSISASGSYTRLDEAPYMDASQFGDMFAPLMVPFEYLVDQGYLDPATLEGLSGGGADRIYLGDDDIYSLGISVTQPLFTGGALLSAHGAASHAAAAGALNAERTEDQVRYDATEAYMALVAARAALVVTDGMLTQMQSHLSDVEAFYEEGMLLESDLMLARVRMSEIELNHNRAGHLVGLAGAALSFAIGIDVDTVIEPVDTLDSGQVLSGDVQSLTERALSRRPDLAAMDELVGAADNGVTHALAGYFPQLVLMGNYNWDRPNREYEPEFYDHWSATLALQMNVFDWGGTSGRVSEARAGFTQTERMRDMFEDAVRLEVKRSYLTHNEVLESLAIAEEGLAHATEAMRVARESFRNGLATSSDVLDAQTALANAEMNRIRAMTALRVSEARLVLAVGGTDR
jgi:outer membrane protein TolC